MKLTLQDRVSVKQLTEAGFNSPTIAQQLGCSVTTVRYWRRKFRRQGVLALTHWQGRPIKGALSTYPDWVRQRLFEYRQSHPGWGPKTLRAQLQSEGIAACFIPSRASIARWLAHPGLAYPYHRHSQLPTVAVPVASAPMRNGRWMPVDLKPLRTWAKLP